MLLRTILLDLVLFLIGLTMIMYMYFVQSYVIKRHLRGEQAALYLPHNVLKKVIVAGLIGAILMFGVASVVQSIGMLQNATQSGRESMENSWME